MKNVAVVFLLTMLFVSCKKEIPVPFKYDESFTVLAFYVHRPGDFCETTKWQLLVPMNHNESIFDSVYNNEKGEMIIRFPSSIEKK
jgi:hypothetical protein